MMFAEFRQGNFDLMRWRSPHRYGRWAKIQVASQLGARSNEAVLALEEPWFLNRRVAQVSNCSARNPIITVPITMNCGLVSNLFQKAFVQLVEGRCSTAWKTW